MVSYTHITSCLRVINMFPFVPLLNHPRISPINSKLLKRGYWRTNKCNGNRPTIRNYGK